MRRLILIVGGVRSGKSSYAVECAKNTDAPVTFVATAIPFDKEMKKRIEEHKKLRPSSWKIIEEGKDIARALDSLKGASPHTILIDCLGIFITNLLMNELIDEDILMTVKSIIEAVMSCDHSVIIVSNEVGMGIVPDNKLSRRFRDLVGFANQMIAKNADQVIVMHCGIPMYIKGGERDGQIK